MSKLKKMLAVISVVVLLSVSTGSIASANLGQKSFDSTPAFLQNTGAVMMTDGQMAEVRGEGFAVVVIIGAAVTTIASITTAYALMLTGNPEAIRTANEYLNKL